MTKHLFELIVAVLFLGCAIWISVAYFFSSPDEPLEKVDDAITYTFVSDTSNIVVSSREGRYRSRRNFLSVDQLKKLPMKMGPWSGKDKEIADQNIVLYREYLNQEDRKIFLLATHAHYDSAFHAAEVCYYNAGWAVETAGYKKIEMAGETYGVRRVIFKRGEFRHVVFYWYLWKSMLRQTIEGCTLFRFSVVIDKDMSERDAEKLALEFAFELAGKPIQSDGGKRDGLDQDVVFNMDANTLGSLRWLKNQIVPNEKVPDPVKNRRALVLSYELEPTDKGYSYIYSRSAIYDVALAIIALNMCGDTSRAAMMAETAASLAEVNPSLYFAYNTHNTYPMPQDDDEMTERSGASGWLGYALCFHLRVLLKKNPNILKIDDRAQKIRDAAIKIAEALLQRQVTKKSDLRYGLIRGGENAHYLKVDKQKNEVVEDFKRETIQWTSMEHNLDLYFFFRDLGFLTQDEKYYEVAGLISNALQSRCWNKDKGMFNRGQRLTGPDKVMALDCASWGGLYCLASGNDKRAHLCLKAAEDFKSQGAGSRGYKAYSEKLIYEVPEVSQFYYPDNPQYSWKEANMVWSEGSFGVILLMQRLGRYREVQKALRDILPMRRPNGGWVYNTEEVPHEFSAAPSVAGTAWFLIVQADRHNPFVKGMFWGKEP